MSNKHEKQESRKDLKTKLLRQIEETGYPVELKVGSIFSKYGWEVEHNRYFVDEDEQKGREIDIIAYTYLNSKKYKLSVGISAICEVKKSLKNPWVILSTVRRWPEGQGWERLHYTIGQVESKLLSFEDIERRSTTSQFKRIGRSYYEGFKLADAKSTIFTALASVVKASEYWLKKQEEAINSLKTRGEYKKDFRELLFVDHIVVLDGLLYEAHLDDDGHLNLNEISYIPVSFRYVSKAYDHRYLVEIVTIDELPHLLLKKHKWITNIKDIMINNLRKSAK